MKTIRPEIREQLEPAAHYFIAMLENILSAMAKTIEEAHSTCPTFQADTTKKNLNENLLLRPIKAFELADIPRSTGYLLIRSGELPGIRIGRAIRIPVGALKAWIARKQEENNRR